MKSARLPSLLMAAAALVGCSRGTDTEPPCTDCTIEDGGTLPDAGEPDALPEEDAGCRPPSFGGRPVVYAHGPARPLEPSTGPATDFLAVIDTELGEIVEYIPLDCEDEGGGYLDLAVDSEGQIMLAGANIFARFDPETHECTTVRSPVDHFDGDDPSTWYTEMVETPNNLTFVPPGVLDPTREMMAGIGYRMIDPMRRLFESGFMRYSPDTAMPELVYEWPDLDLSISGDLVVVQEPCTFEPRSYVTVTGRREATHCHACQDGETPGVDCGDCLYELDVRTGRIADEVALLPAHGVFGLALFGDAIYGFSAGNYFEMESGRIFAVRVTSDDTEIVEIPVTPPEGFASIHWHGAGSTVLAPLLF